LFDGGRQVTNGGERFAFNRKIKLAAKRTARTMRSRSSSKRE
jgi:hypothetical protein